jgi:tripartite-type tricarboxylate transporter receptor subunit TctC
VPTFTEAGLPNFDVGIWFGVLAPAGTPPLIIDKLSGEINKLLAAQATREKLLSLGMDTYISTPEQMLARMKADSKRFGDVIKTANITLEN